MTTARRWLVQLIRLCLNWGILIALVGAVLALRYDADAAASAPLAVPRVHLSGAQARQWRAFPAYHGIVPVLVYHGINPSVNALTVTRQDFAAEILALRTAGFHTITLLQYVRFVQHRPVHLPPKPILLTFDDGRLDAYRGAENVLRKYRLHAAMFTFASWSVANPTFNLNWAELASMQRSDIWSVQEHGGQGHESVVVDANGTDGATFGFRQFLRARDGNGGHLESFRAFTRRFTSNVLWGRRQFAAQVPGYRPLAFAVPEGNYGQDQTNDIRIPQFTLPWLRRHFDVIFGGDYLAQGQGRRFELRDRFSPTLSYRIAMGGRTTLPVLYCRLRDWVTRVALWREYGCLRLGPDIDGIKPDWEDRHERGLLERPAWLPR